MCDLEKKTQKRKTNTALSLSPFPRVPLSKKPETSLTPRDSCSPLYSSAKTPSATSQAAASQPRSRSLASDAPSSVVAFPSFSTSSSPSSPSPSSSLARRTRAISGRSTSLVSRSRYAPFSGELSKRERPLRFQKA